MDVMTKAKLYWSRQEVLPLDLAASLMELGYDVDKLESYYMKKYATKGKVNG